jgi:hypothetical protein
LVTQTKLSTMEEGKKARRQGSASKWRSYQATVPCRLSIALITQALWNFFKDT